MRAQRTSHKPAGAGTPLDSLYLSGDGAPLDATMLSSLLGHSGHLEDSAELSQITDPTVLLGLHSLDDFERQAAGCLADTQGADSMVFGGAFGAPTFDEAELSAALEQIDWAGFLPAVENDAPTPTTTPVVGQWNEEEEEEQEDEEEGEGEAEAAMELEELSMFSVFLSNMKAFEAFLAGLSLNQLRQCAATINAVLVRRESAMDALGVAPAASSVQQSVEPKNTARAKRQSRMLQEQPQPHTQLQSQPQAQPQLTQLQQPQPQPQQQPQQQALPESTLELLREWLAPDTADCVITALQAANLATPTHTSPETPLPTPTTAPAPETTTTAPAPPKAVTSTAAAVEVAPSSSLPPPSPVATPQILPAPESQQQKQQRQPPPQQQQQQTQTQPQPQLSSPAADGPSLTDDAQGVPWLSFSYAQKGQTRRYRVRMDIDRAPLSGIPQSIQANNCVYPRANCSRASYKGNRWDYETECNVLGWKLAFLNQQELSGRRGLLQTAVNNYRAMVAGCKSRRIARLEKARGVKRPATQAAVGGEKRTCVANDGRTAVALQRATSAPSASALPAAGGPQSSAKYLTTGVFLGGRFTRIRINIDFHSIDTTQVDTQFRTDHAVFPRALRAPREKYELVAPGRWEFEVACNELAWKLAWLNKTRLRGRKPLIQKCLDAYRARFSVPPWRAIEGVARWGEGVDRRFYAYWRPRPGKRAFVGEDAAQGGAPEAEAGESAVASSPVSVPPPVALKQAAAAQKPPALRIKPAVLQPPPPPQLLSPPPTAVARPPVHTGAHVRPIAPAVSPVRTHVQQPAAGVPPSFPRSKTLPPISAAAAAVPTATATKPRPPQQAQTQQQKTPQQQQQQQQQRQKPQLQLQQQQQRPAPPRPHLRPPAPSPAPASPAPSLQNLPPAGKSDKLDKLDKSDKSAKAQAAAHMLTGVLRQLAKKDPALASLNGVLEKNASQPSRAAADDDDDSPLDARLAEAEKLIASIHGK